LEIYNVDSVIGLSMGGGVAIGFALAFPEIARNLILVDSALDGYEWSSEWNSSWNSIVQKAKSAGAKEANKLWLEHPLYGPVREKQGVGEKLVRIVEDYSGWYWTSDDAESKYDHPDIERLSTIKSRTLIIIGEKDLPDFHSIANILQEKIPNSQTSRIQGVGHMANMEAPEQFNRIVLEFLDGR
jgi:3-oxoadipate enol-lactonase